MKNVFAALVNLQGRLVTPYSATDGTQVIATDGTVTLPTYSSIKRLNPAAAVTGVILPVGREEGDTVTLVNISANSITFAAAATSRVADGASAVIAALTRMTLIWDATAARWFHGN